MGGRPRDVRECPFALRGRWHDLHAHVLGYPRLDSRRRVPDRPIRRQHGVRQRLRTDGRLADPRRGKRAASARPRAHESDAAGPLAADLLLSHTHWDHIQGLPFFKPLSAPGNSFCIMAPPRRGWRWRRSCAGRWTPWCFPVPLTRARRGDSGHGDQRRRDRARGFHRPSVPPSPSRNHAGLSTGPRRWRAGVRLRHRQRAGRWRDDTRSGPIGAASLVQFLTGADTLIHDAMYAETDHAGALRVGTLDPAPGGGSGGRGRVPATGPLSSRAGARRRGDRPPPRRHSRLSRPGRHRGLEVDAASEGMEFEL